MVANFKFLILLVPLVLGRLHVTAQDITNVSEPLFYNESVSKLLINQFHQDDFGFIWMATNRGIDRYDGNTVANFFPSSFEGRLNLFENNTEVVNLTSLPGGQFCWATKQIFYTYNHENDSLSIIKFNSIIAGDYNISGFVALPSGHFVLATERSGLYLVKDSYIKEIDLGLDLVVHTIKKCLNGEIWIASSKGLIILSEDLGIINHFTSSNSPLLSNRVNTLFEDVTGRVYVGTQTGVNYINEFSKEINVIKSVNNYEVAPVVRNFTKDNQGSIYFSTNKRIYKIEPKEKFNTKPLVDFDLKGVKNIFIDKKNVLWVNIFNSGLRKISLSNRLFNSFSRQGNDLENVYNYNIAKLRPFTDSTVACLTNSGFFIFNPKLKANLGHISLKRNNDYSRNGDIVTDLVINPEEIYVATKSGMGLLRHNDSTFVLINIKGMPRNIEITSLVKINQNNILAVTNYKIYLVDLVQRQASVLVNEIFMPEQVLVVNNNLYYLNNDTLMEKPIVPNGKSTTIASGILVFGLIDNILKAINTQKQLITYALHSKQLTDTMLLPISHEGLKPRSILLDGPNAEEIWIVGERNILYYNTKTGFFNKYTPSDGLMGWPYNINSIALTQNGYLMVGGTQGFDFCYTQEVVKESFSAEPLITNISVMFKNYFKGPERFFKEPAINNIEIPYNKNTISIALSTDHYTKSNQSQIRYNLSTQPENWVTLGNNKTLTLTDLRPGNYVLKIKASSAVGIWNETGRVLTINVVPPFWLTTWFKILIAILFVSGVLLYIKYRTQKVKSQNEHLELTVIERTKQLATINKELEQKNKTVKQNADELMQANKILDQMRKKAEDAAIAKENFLSTMSHEIRTPLNAVIGIANLLKIEGPNNENFEENLNTLFFSAENLLGIINDILEFNRLESEKTEFEKQEFSVKNLLEKLIINFKQQANPKGIKLALIAQPQLSGQVIGDPYRLTQVLNNLLSNAIKFTEKGSVTLKAEMVSATEHKLKIQFAVIDTGIGISAEKVNTIFERFTQEDSETTRKFGGTGLGLSICQKILALQNSKLTVQSTKGKGSTFTFLLEFEKPMALNRKIRETETDHKAQATEKLKGTKVLVVEDNTVNRLIAVRILKLWDADVDEATNGVEAVAKAFNQPYDIIIMDLQMPDKDGFEASKNIKQNPSTKHIPIIALSADTSPKTIDKARKAHINDVLGKPFRPEDLLKKMHQLLNSNGLIGNIAYANTEANRPGTQKLNFEKAFSLAGIDKEFINLLLTEYIKLFERIITQVKLGIQKNKPEILNRIKHEAQPTLILLEAEQLFENLTKLIALMEQDKVDDNEAIKLKDDIIYLCQMAIEETKDQF